MALMNMHRADVKAGLEKRFGSVAAFERALELPEKSVNDVLRGRPRKHVRDAIEKALATPVPLLDESEVSDTSAGATANHRQSAEAR